MDIVTSNTTKKLIIKRCNFTFADFDEAIIGTSSTSSIEAATLPINAIVVAATLTLTTPFNCTAAMGTLTFTGNVSANDTVTIDDKVYTFKASPAADYDVDIGTDLATTILNLYKCINKTGSTGYYISTPIHPTVSATYDATHLYVYAKTFGTGGNSLASTEASTACSWGAATLAGGNAGSDLVSAFIGAEEILAESSIAVAAVYPCLPGTVMAAETIATVTWNPPDSATNDPTAGVGKLEITYYV
jgi:hypothetical protein